jgi:hypothetical protein
MQTNTRTQADGEGPESVEEVVAAAKPATYTCWDCGTEFVPLDNRQRECLRCWADRKL